MNNVLSIKNLNKRFESVDALSDFTLDVAERSILGLLGPNGAGKTTLLRIINGILAKDSGSVEILGKDVNLDTARNIGYMPEERGLYDNMTVENQILYFGQLKGGKKPRLREVMKEYLQLFNLDGSERRKLKELSKGNQQKVQIVSTLVHEPALVILDEPFSGFDPINGALLQQLIERLHDNGTTVMLSSHNMHAVEEMCDTIALVNHGRLLISGRIEDVKEANKTDEIVFTTTSPLSLPLLLSSGMVEWVKEDACKNFRKGFAYRLRKNPGVPNTSIIHDIAAQSDVLQYEEALPSLNDIFLKYTTKQNEQA